jgi:hypothetical protein
MNALTNRFVSRTARKGLLPRSSLAPDFLDECGYITEHLVRILVGVAVLNALNRLPPLILCGTVQSREVLWTDNDGDRLTVSFNDYRFVRFLYGTEEVGKVGLGVWH